MSALGPSRRVVYKLSALFSLDSFAGGFVVPSILALWLFERFELSLTLASVFFFWTNVLSALSYPAAARLARRFGLVNTMVFTHIPASVCLIVAAFSSSLPIVLGLLLVRAALAQMDVPTRTSYVMAVVTPPERPAAASVTAVPRSLASSISPTLSGALLGALVFALFPVLHQHIPSIGDLQYLLTGLAAISVGRDPNGIGGHIADIAERLRNALAARGGTPGSPESTGRVDAPELAHV